MRRFTTQQAFKVDNPFNGSTYCTIQLLTEDAVKTLVQRSQSAQSTWKHVSLQERIRVCTKFMEYFEVNKDEVAKDISGQMGKPVKHALGEIGGLGERTRAFIDMAPTALSNFPIGPTTNNKDTINFSRTIVKEPVGTVLTLAPWNYPLLTAVNSVIPAVLAGNAVLVNHGFRAPLVSEHFQKAFEYAGGPPGLVSSLKCDYETLHRGIRAGLYDFVSFTGSVPGGRAVQQSVAAANERQFIDATLELGGNDGAYVSEQCKLGAAVATIVDGAMFNAGQSCCGIERVFVHESMYDSFIEKARQEILDTYNNLGDPTEADTVMGPMAQPQATEHLSNLVRDATSKGAKVVLGGKKTDHHNARFFSPTLISDCDSSMMVMKEESFGPLLAVQKVGSMDEGIRGINGSLYGLTSAIFTQNKEEASRFGDQVDVGTVFMNRADYLDPYMPWQGRKLTGKGLSLSQFGFEAFTRLKNYHFKFI